MRKSIAWMLLSWVGVSACAPRMSQVQWYEEYGRFHGCAVVGAREQEYVGRRGFVHERAETCYRCPGEAPTYCFAGRPVGPPAAVMNPAVPPGPPPPMPPGPPPGMPPPR